MRNPFFRQLLSAIIAMLLPGVLLAADTGAAMLYGNGTTWVNGSSIPKSSAIFSGDLVQTKTDSVANINAAGSSVIIQPDSLIQFQGSSVKLEHGGITISTSKAMGTQADDLTVTPASNDWTEFDVRNVNGTIQIVARKGDLVLQDATGLSTLPQGQQMTRATSEANTARKKSAGAAPAAVGGVMNSTAAFAAGLAGAGALGTWVFMQGDDPISPHKPK
jgi:hypothetical protein